MIIRPKTIWIMLNASLVALLVGALVWLANSPRHKSSPDAGSGPRSGAPNPTEPALRLGITPERNIFAIKRRYGPLKQYLSKRLGRPVEFATVNTYEGVLKDFAEKQIDGAFLGSLVGVLAMDRLGAKPIVVPQRPDGGTSYHGVAFVRADSPVKRLAGLAGRSIAMVRTTTAGHIFPGCVLMKQGLWDRPDQPRIIWLGTHDDVVTHVMEGRADVGAVKNLRLDALLQSHPEWKIRRLAVGRDVPNNALVLRKDLVEKLGPTLSQILLEMDADPKGREALKAMGVVRFVTCTHMHFEPVYRMTECVTPAWKQIGVPGAPPARPSTWPEITPQERKQYKCYEESS